MKKEMLSWNIVSKSTFLVSALFTIFLITSQSNSLWYYPIFFIMAVSMEIVKYKFFKVGMAELKKDNNAIGYSYITISAVLVLLSIVASLAFMYNQNSEIKTDSMLMSEEYTRQQGLYNGKQGEINALQTQIKALPSNYITKKAQLSANVSTKSKELAKINAGFKTLTVESSAGYAGFLNSIVDFVNKEAKKKPNYEPLKVELLETLLFTIIAIVFEILAVMSNYQYQRLLLETIVIKTNLVEEDHDINDTDNGKVIDISKPKAAPAINNFFTGDGNSSPLSPIDIGSSEKVSDMIQPEAQSNRKIGFVVDREVELIKEPDTCIYTREDIQEYLKYMYSDMKKNSVSPGTGLMKSHTYLSLKQIKGIRYHLEKLGIVKINNKINRTFVLIPTLNQALQLI